MSTLPTFTKNLDDMFVETWYKIKPDAVDNILDSLVLWNILRAQGVMESQTGSDMITETIKYARSAAATWIDKGSVLTQGEPETETMAIWNWTVVHSHVQRNLIDDAKNAGPFRIKSYVAKRIKDAREELSQAFEAALEGAFTSTETNSLAMMGLNHFLPPFASRATGTFGGIARSNSWWQNKYKDAAGGPMEVNLVSDMRNLYNTVHNNQIPPNLITTDQTTYEVYEDFGLDAIQIAGSQRLLDLSFETLKFKGKDMVWTANHPAGTMRFLNTDFMRIYFNPALWFDMTEFKVPANSTSRIAHIFCMLQMTGTQPRRSGLLYNIS